MRAPDARSKIVTLRALIETTAGIRRSGETIVFTNGCFDLLHEGHLRSLEKASALGDRLIVAVNLDASVRRAKGRDRPIQPARVRMELVAALACVDWVVAFGADTPIRLIRSIRPDVLAKGGDWLEGAVVGREEVLESGGRVVRLPIVPHARTTELVERIRNKAARRKR